MSDRGDIIVFDVAETLLDLGVLAPVFARLFGDEAMVRTWFDQTIIYAEALTLAGEYADSGTVGAAVLRMMAASRSRPVTDSDLDELKRLSAAMPTYADTKPARDSYLALADTLGVAPAALWLVSCHPFDTLGAAAVGYRTALLLRPGIAPVALGRPPDVIGTDLRVIADQLIHR